MNMITKAMVGLARGFLAYIDESNNKEIGETQRHEPAFDGATIPRSLIEKVNPWENSSLEDMPGEEWRSIDIPTRVAMISNMGRLKILNGKKKPEAFEIARPIISKSAASFQVWQLGKKNAVTLSIGREVLLAFQGKPEWAEKYPSVVRRSARGFFCKNGNHRDCRLENLSWETEGRARGLQTSLDFADEKNKQAVEATAEPTPPVEAADPDDLYAWIDVEHFVGFYQVNKAGEVRSLGRYIHRYGARRPEDHGMSVYLAEGEINPALRKAYRFVRGVTLKPLRLKGEKIVQLCREGTAVQVPVARLLIENFNPTLDKSYKYDYIDGDLNNCSLANLRVYL